MAVDATIATKFFEAGFSILPVNEKKKPTVNSWTGRQQHSVKPNGDFAGGEVSGIALICGRVSGGIEIVDFDLKNDTTGMLMKDFREALRDNALLKKLVVQKTPSGGFHFIYRCEEIEGNLKLARRRIAPEEGREEKVMAMIETRGEGGYFLVEPSVGYKIIQGDIFNIPVISIDERERLHSTARQFNSHIKEEIDYKRRNFEKNYKDSPFGEFDDRFDIVSFLETEGWNIFRQAGDKIHLCRPGKSKSCSATYFQSTKKLYVFTTSSEFDSDKAYSPTSVYSILRCGGDLSIASREIRKMGYGKRPEKSTEDFKLKEQVESVEAKETIWDWEGVDDYLDAVIGGTLQVGLSTGMRRMDDHFRFKRGNLNVFCGHDNVGKSIYTWFLMLITAKKYGWKWVVYTAENQKRFFMRKCIEFLNAKPLNRIERRYRFQAELFVQDHFFLIDNSSMYTYYEIIKLCETKKKDTKIDGLLIDPYNGLKKDHKVNSHEYDYEVMNTFQHYTKSTDTCLFLNCHVYTGAFRKTDSDGYSAAPDRFDVEGGLKFSSKSDDFITVHRVINHPTDWTTTQIHVRRVREHETGGKATPKDNPLKFQMLSWATGFIDEYGWNPLTETQHDQILESKQAESNRYNPDKFTEAEKEPEEPLPF